MTVTVAPETFTMVLFEHGPIVEAVARIASQIGIADDEAIRVDIDERNPLAHARIVSIDPIVLAVDGGALEDPRHPRHLSEAALTDTIGRLLIQALDRRSPGFADAPEDQALSLPHRMAWDVYAIGRLERLGHNGQRQRRLYGFRNRHGFSDVSDAAFEQLWQASDLTWADLTTISDQARAVSTA